jgi:hypothetical protein
MRSAIGACTTFASRRGVSEPPEHQPRGTRPRSKTIAPKALRREVRSEGLVVLDETDRPRHRRDCMTAEQVAAEYLLRQEEGEDVSHLPPPADGVNCERPCPWVSCKHNQYLDVNEETGAIKLNFPDLQPEEMQHSCSLDLADRHGITLEEVASTLNLTRERIRQVEVRGLLMLKTANVDFEDPAPRRLSPLGAAQVEEGVGGDRSETVHRAHVNEKRRKLGHPELKPERAAFIPRGHLPPPVERTLWRCSFCSVRVEESALPEHTERHRAEGVAFNFAFEVDNSVQKPVGRPEGVALVKLVAKKRREQSRLFLTAPRSESRPIERDEPVDDEPREAQPSRLERSQPKPETRTMENGTSDLLTNAEVCQILDCTPANPPYLANAGRIEKHAPGKYTRASVEAYKLARANAPKPGRKSQESKPKPSRIDAIKQRAAKPPRPSRPKAVKPPPETQGETDNSHGRRQHAADSATRRLSQRRTRARARRRSRQAERRGRVLHPASAGGVT